MNQKNVTQNFCLWCELLAQQIALQVEFYCTPETMKMNGWIRMTFMY